VIFVIPVLERMARIDLRTVTLDIPPQDVITKDNVTVKVSAVAVFSRRRSFAARSPRSRTTCLPRCNLRRPRLRSVGGQTELDELLSQRDKLNARIQEIVDSQTEPWGVKSRWSRLKNIDLPQTCRRAIAAQAEAERERRAQGDRGGGRNSRPRSGSADAAEIMSKSPITLPASISADAEGDRDDHNSTTVFPMPIDLFETLSVRSQKQAGVGDDKPKT